MTLKTLLNKYGVVRIKALEVATGMHSQAAWNLWHGKHNPTVLQIRLMHDNLGIPLEELYALDYISKPRAAKEEAKILAREAQTDAALATTQFTAAKTIALQAVEDAINAALRHDAAERRKAELDAHLQQLAAVGKGT